MPIRSLLQKTERDLLEWYPPVFLHSHPEVREALSELSPTIKAALEIEEKVFSTVTDVFLNVRPT